MTADERPSLDVTDAARGFVGAELLQARKAKNAVAISVLRSVAAAIDNAGAVPVPESAQRTDPAASSPYVAVGGPAGASEAVRRQLGADDLKALLANEVERRAEAARTYLRLGRPLEAQGAEDELLTLAPLVVRILASLEH